MKTITGVLILAAAVAVHAGSRAPADLEAYNLAWTSPSTNAAGSMPVGNGEVGLNVWVEADGDLRMYISRTDAWSEACRLMKAGALRLHLDPNPFAKGLPFRQELRLREGRIDITAGPPESAVTLRVWVDADAPVVRIAGESRAPVAATVRVESWRTERRVLTDGPNRKELESSWTLRDAPAGVEVVESADVFPDRPGAVLAWYHRNETSMRDFTLAFQGLASLTNRFPDPLLRRTFGGLVRAPGFERRDARTLATRAPVRAFEVAASAPCAQTATADEWLALAAATLDSAHGARRAQAATAAWWSGFWDRSWIFVEGDGAPGGLPTNSHALRIGSDSAGRSRFTGSIPRASLYACALPPAAIARLAASPAGTPPPVREGLAATMSNVTPGTVLAPAASLPPAFTIEAWIRSGPEENGRIFDKVTPGGSDGFLFDAWPKLALRLIIGPEAASAAGLLRPGALQHVAFVVDPAAGNRAVYLDGRVVLGGIRADDAPPPPSRVTQAYVLQRWMTACGGRGAFPIKFNGSIFTVEPGATDDSPHTPDWRRWGDCFWWQNTRLPYGGMCARGETDLMEPLFRYHIDGIPLCAERARIYFGADGAYFPETLSAFYSYSNRDYGWNRAGKAANFVDSPWWANAWNQGPELLMLMLDRWEHTDDAEFARATLVPAARSILRYFETRFPASANGRRAIAPTQSVETYWHGVTNDLPALAGLHAVLPKLIALPDGLAPAADRERWRALLASLAPVPLREEGGRRFILPAESFDPKRSNCENPELYAIYPYRLFGVGKPDLAAAIETFARRGTKATAGWSYDAQCAAMTGQADEAARQVRIKARNGHWRHRFPAMWGPNYDWVPDQDHGANLMIALQTMVLQAERDRIDVLPAWPKGWNVKFKLHAPDRTVIEGEYRDGALKRLDVTPGSRRAAVTVHPGQPGDVPK
ncbi:MAG: hypothetical protein KJ579_10590 [Verrucomicrobia bacterium]|nr:hypothetical protein [Verrucomicrobiota bacterium]